MEDDQNNHLVDGRCRSMIEVEKSLSKLKETVSAWPILSADDLEPEYGLMVEHLEDMLSCLDRLCGDDEAQTNSVISGEDDNHTPNDMSENEESGPTKHEATVILRCQFVVSETLKGPLNLSELLDNLLMPEPRFRHDAEDLGLCRVFRGYENVADITWIQLLARHTTLSDSCSILIQNVNNMDAVQAIDERLWMRQQARRQKIHKVTSALRPFKFLNSADSFLAGQTFAKFLIRQIEAIKFAFDWNKQSEKPGVKKFKREFTKKAFEADPMYRLLQYDDSVDEDKYKRTFSTFKTKHGKTVTARNYLLRLYQRFGCAILLDQTWDVNKLVGCSKSFQPLLVHLTTSNEDLDVVNAQRGQIGAKHVNQACLKSLLSCLGDETLVDHLRQFLVSYPVRSDILRI